MLVKNKDDFGQEQELYIDQNLSKNLEEVKHSVLDRGWDYVSVVSGIVGVGKSTFAQALCKYLDPTFTTKERVCFAATGEKGIIERTTKGKLGQAFMLDESFESMNTKVSKSSEFLKLLNHLQLIRQRGLYIILCLPNFFDLSKTIAIFRTSHLFVVYHDKYKRGFFAAFGRDKKRQLYIKGNKFVDYNCVAPNFRGRFVKRWIADQELYEKLKFQHLEAQAQREEKKNVAKDTMSRDNFVRFLVSEGYPVQKIAEVGNFSKKTAYNIINRGKENGQ